MEFRLEFFPKPFKEKIEHPHRLMLVGSCFTEQIGSRFAAHKFRTFENPNGILFNPASIVQNLISYIEGKQYSAEELFLENELWGSWDHHTKFSDISQQAALQKINSSQAEAHRFLKEADWLVLTLGSAFVYEKEGRIVANCHKVPTDKFKKRLMSTEEVISTLDTCIHRLKHFNPALRIIFTISPVRHLRDGFIENNRSKATLINAVHHLVDKFDKLFYFPAYELVIDDLRDYRFYAEDMVHPNYSATNYVWEKFVGTCISEPAQQLMKEINVVNAAKNHKAFNPQSVAHLKFKEDNLKLVKSLAARYDYIDLQNELDFFSE